MGDPMLGITVESGSAATDVFRCCATCRASFRTQLERCPLDGAHVNASDTDPLVGATLGQYQLEALVGVGGMGRVYRAHHTRLTNKRYAVKILYGDLTASSVMRMRFAHEAESASRLDHPNVVGVLDVGCTDEGLMYLVMDFVEGPTLGALIDRGPMTPARAVRFARQLCAGIGHAHDRGIIHRDFKPDNILASGPPGAEILRIADFGLAISIDEADAESSAESGIVCTPVYAAPEQLLGCVVDHRADLYALGVTLYEMLTGGKLPFKRQAPVLWKVTTDWPSASMQSTFAPDELTALIERLLARDPRARPGSAREVLRVLDNLMLFVPTQTRRRRWTRTRIALTAVMIAVAGSLAAAQAAWG